MRFSFQVDFEHQHVPGVTRKSEFNSGKIPHTAVRDLQQRVDLGRRLHQMFDILCE